MPGKQFRYRDRKKKQGYVRVEVLVPAESAGFVTAYARALRDAEKLSMRIPTFEGMTNRDGVASEQEPQANITRPAHIESPGVTSSPFDKPNPDIHQSASRPDFSGGLFDTK